jgi:hypothetical protein
VLVDEWESVEQFQQFFSNPELQAFIGGVLVGQTQGVLSAG